MNLNISYGSTSGAPAAFFSAVNYVVGLFDAIFTNNATVNIEIGYGTFPSDGSTVPPLAESQQANLVFGNYTQVRQALLNESAPGATTLPAASPLSGGLVLGSAQERALGLIGASSALDGWVGVASDVTLQQIGGSWSYSATATPSNNQYYLVGALEHEITEVMGRTSYLPVRNEYGVMDLYRYKASGVRQTGTGGPAYFSTNSGATNLDNWNTQAGGDIGDWASSAGADAFLAFNPSGQLNAMTPTDLTLMSAIGWTTRTYFAPGLPLNLVYTATGSTLPAPMPGQFNLELFNNGTGTGSIATASGHQGVALVSADGRTVSLLHGDYGLVDSGANGGNNLIFLGDGSESIGGAVGDTILGGSGANQFLDGHLGHQSITGGTAGNEMIWGAATDTVRGGSGGNETIAGVPGETTFGSSGANVFINATGGNQSVLGGSAGNDSVWTAAGDTIHGGSNNETVGGVAGVTMIGGTGGNQFLDASQGHQSVLGGSGGNETIWGAATDTITGGSGGNETIGGVAGETILGGSGANIFINATGGNQSIDRRRHGRQFDRVERRRRHDPRRLGQRDDRRRAERHGDRRQWRQHVHRRVAGSPIDPRRDGRQRDDLGRGDRHDHRRQRRQRDDRRCVGRDDPWWSGQHVHQCDGRQRLDRRRHRQHNRVGRRARHGPGHLGQRHGIDRLCRRQRDLLGRWHDNRPPRLDFHLQSVRRGPDLAEWRHRRPEHGRGNRHK